MKVLVTGSNGFLGRRLCQSLTSRDHTVIGFDLPQDILNAKEFDDAMATNKPNAVIHLAAIADLNHFRGDEERCWNINVKGTKNVLESCTEHNARLLFASTCCAYGNNPEHPCTESAPLCPTEPYARSKAESEKDVVAAGLPHVILRLATFYGPGMRGALAPAVFIDRAHRGEMIHVHGTGKQTRTYTDVDDIVSGIVTVLESDPMYTVVNISHSETWSVMQLIELAGKVSGKEVRFEHTTDREGQIYSEEIDNSRLKSLGWSPRYNMEEGMRRSYEDYIARGGRWSC
eukprot:GILJ01000052.1.p1 GENE.GILJ01000052.1~~GILJ01000052.1.p1  ORF type:complete len:314 (-),score=40.01 GILJ01000052.1:137-1000(-)